MNLSQLDPHAAVLCRAEQASRCLFSLGAAAATSLLSFVVDTVVVFFTLFRHEVPLAIACLILGSGFLHTYFPAFWAIPTKMLSEASAAATFGLINSIGQLGGLAGNYAIGFFNDRTHSLAARFTFIALVYGAAGGLIISLRVRDPAGAFDESN